MTNWKGFTTSITLQRRPHEDIVVIVCNYRFSIHVLKKPTNTQWSTHVLLQNPEHAACIDRPVHILSFAGMLRLHRAFLLLLPSQFGRQQFFYAQTNKSDTSRHSDTSAAIRVPLPVLQLHLIGNLAEQVEHSAKNLSDLRR